MIIDNRTHKKRQVKTDFTWFLERQHRDGHWEMVHSKGKASFNRNRDAQHLICGTDPKRMIQAEDGFGEWDRDWIGVLNGDYPIQNQIQPLAIPGWPANTSTFLSQEFSESMFIGAAHFTLGMMRRETRAPKAAPSGYPAQIMLERLAHLEYILSAPWPVMFGRLRDPQVGAYTDMINGSNHDRMVAAKRSTELMPIADESVRVLMG